MMMMIAIKMIKMTVIKTEGETTQAIIRQEAREATIMM